MLSGFSLIHINNQHKLQLKKKEIIFVQDNLSEVYEVLSVLLGTLSSRNADGDRDTKTCEKGGERTPLWWEFTNTKLSTVGNCGFRAVKLIAFTDIRPLFIRMS